MVVDHRFYMQLCLNEAWQYQALTYPNPPVGALILNHENRILSIHAHHAAGNAHAELNACIEAVIVLGDTTVATLQTPTQQHEYLCKNYQNYFQGCTIYVTLEPCMHYGATPPCSLLIQTLGFSQVIIGALDPNPEAKGGKYFLTDSGIAVQSGILKEACEAMIYPFLKWQRKEPFIFFKLAKHQNGTISGQHVSSQQSRTLVHQIRSKIDLLVIGGDTVRLDRPTLDCRLAKSHDAPDILIYTSHDDIDRDIPLFHIKDRKVYIEDNFSRLASYGHVMIEGGEGMFKKTKDIIDFYLFFTSPNMHHGKKIETEANLKSLHCFKNSSDTIEWFQNIL